MGPQIIPIFEDMIPFEREMFLGVTRKAIDQQIAKQMQDQHRLNMQMDKQK